jgi:capsular polysaccharide transport system permease protein
MQQAVRDYYSASVTFGRVIVALVLREARVRYGRSRLGYTWAVVEPAIMIAFLTVVFTAFRNTQPAAGSSFAIFFATGVLPFQLFRSASTRISSSIEANRPLFNYPLVRQFDTVFARAVLEVSTHIVVMVLVFTIQIIYFRASPPADIGMMLIAIGLMSALAMGIGMNIAILTQILPSITEFYAVIMGAGFFLSAVIYPLSVVPSYYRQFLLWNPLVHGIEAFRAGFFAGYRAADLDLAYLSLCALATIAIGMIADRMVTKDET